MEYREAQPSDIPSMEEFIFEHGTSEWNFLPVAGVKSHLEAIQSGDTVGVIAVEKGQMLGFATYYKTNNFRQYEEDTSKDTPHGYIAEVVVSRAAAGRGIGTELLEQCKTKLQENGITRIYIERHEENKASAGMMRKAGFEEVITFSDPDRRPTGSGNTTVSRFVWGVC